jgi:hypothetical protein
MTEFTGTSVTSDLWYLSENAGCGPRSGIDTEPCEITVLVGILTGWFPEQLGQRKQH